jgi:hypothetical protein
MTKEQIFFLYGSNPNQKVSFKCDKETADKHYGIADAVDTVEDISAIWNTFDGGQITFLSDTESSYMISDCQLILKPLSIRQMTEVEAIEFGKLYTQERNDEPTIEYGEKEKDGLLILSGSFTPKTVLWLIQNGYALSDTWFANGIAVEA